MKLRWDSHNSLTFLSLYDGLCFFKKTTVAIWLRNCFFAEKNIVTPLLKHDKNLSHHLQTTDDQVRLRPAFQVLWSWRGSTLRQTQADASFTTHEMN